MAEHEGWQPSGLASTGFSTGSESYRNHNPGNLRSSPFMLGTHDNFAIFASDEIGKFAQIYDLWIKCTGKSVTGLKPTNTLGDLINKYAPPSENDTESYIKSVENYLRIPRTTLLSYFVTI